jgi:Fur family transcriptional regulator, ferric uptake regulator
MTAPARRMTPQRAEILAELRAAHDHPTAADLYERLRPRLPRLSLGTVYRNLDLLVAAGLAAKLTAAGAEARYDGRPAPHDHARCRACGAVADVPALPEPDLPRLPDGFAVEVRHLEYVGLCATCRRRVGAHAAPAAGLAPGA